MVALPHRLRIFPLEQVALFPDTHLPLHVFEPRYRKLVADALEKDRTIGMVLIRRADRPIESTASHQPDRPALYDIGCAGRIVEHELLSDGRSIIVLRGAVRFRIRRELETADPYRVVEAQALYEAPIPAEHMRRWRDELRALVGDYAVALAQNRTAVDRVFAKIDLETLINHLSVSLPISVIEKQSLLECATAEQRFRRLCTVLQYRVAEARLGLGSAREADS